MSLTTEAKNLIYEQMIIDGVSKAELSRITGLAPKEIDRVLSVKHNTKMNTLEMVGETLGIQFRLVARPCVRR